MIAERAEGKGLDDTDPDAYLQAAVQHVEEMFGGARAGLRPVYEALLQFACVLGPDVKACPCKTIVPLYRKHVFAEMKPATRTRIDLSLALQDTIPRGRLLATGGRQKGDRLTHRIPLTSVDDIDAEVKHWLQQAYNRNA